MMCMSFVVWAHDQLCETHAFEQFSKVAPPRSCAVETSGAGLPLCQVQDTEKSSMNSKKKLEVASNLSSQAGWHLWDPAKPKFSLWLKLEEEKKKKEQEAALELNWDSDS